MILADKFSCDMPDFGDTILSCDLPGTGPLDWITGIGTLLSALTAIGLAWHTVRQARKTAERERALERRSTLEKEAEILIAASPKHIADSADIDSIGPLAVLWQGAAERYNRVVKGYGDEGFALGDAVLRLVTETASHLTNKRIVVGGFEDESVQKAIVSRLNDFEQIGENLALSNLLGSVKEHVETAVMAFARANDSEARRAALKEFLNNAKAIRNANIERSKGNS